MSERLKTARKNANAEIKSGTQEIEDARSKGNNKRKSLYVWLSKTEGWEQGALAKIQECREAWSAKQVNTPKNDG